MVAVTSRDFQKLEEALEKRTVPLQFEKAYEMVCQAARGNDEWTRKISITIIQAFRLGGTGASWVGSQVVRSNPLTVAWATSTRKRTSVIGYVLVLNPDLRKTIPEFIEFAYERIVFEMIEVWAEAITVLIGDFGWKQGKFTAFCRGSA